MTVAVTHTSCEAKTGCEAAFLSWAGGVAALLSARLLAGVSKLPLASFRKSCSMA